MGGYKRRIYIYIRRYYMKRTLPSKLADLSRDLLSLEPAKVLVDE
jgi:hypothetical protein